MLMLDEVQPSVNFLSFFSIVSMMLMPDEVQPSVNFLSFFSIVSVL